MRRLAESAGQMLHTLILEGRADVKKIIIGAIISTVQQPGSQPPEDVPALMNILRSTAEEQLSLVQHGNDHRACCRFECHVPTLRPLVVHAVHTISRTPSPSHVSGRRQPSRGPSGPSVLGVAGDCAGAADVRLRA